MITKDAHLQFIDSFICKPLLIDESAGIARLSAYIADLNTLPTDVLMAKLAEQKKNSVMVTEVKSDQYIDYTGLTSISKISTNDSIVFAKLSDVIMLEDGLCHYGVNTLISKIEKAEAQKGTIGTILLIDSPGGDALAANKAYQFFKDKEKPTVALVDYAASGGYFIAAGTNSIIASNSMSQFGSIGAYTSYNKQHINYIRENYIYVYADESEEKNKVSMDIIKHNNFDAAKKMVNQVRDIFANVVIKERNPDASTLKGAMYFANEAKLYNLIDYIGNTATAIDKLYSFIK